MAGAALRQHGGVRARGSAAAGRGSAPARRTPPASHTRRSAPARASSSGRARTRPGGGDTVWSAAPARWRAPRTPPSGMQNMLLQAAYDGDFRLLKRLVRALDKGKGRLRETVEAERTDGGVGALQIAAGNEQLEVCSYLVEMLGVDVNAADEKGG